ncbi:MAG: BglII/BstYI family type II restriction endonuclease [Aeromicrobium sp.]|uniref:BglII/BstYI family type II restriction endonuclease n=1 Tax=Aeromicrobium sp. TaxID=1871063 RepID=UPI0039E51C61
MDLTDSWRDVMPQAIIDRYDFMETRNAAAILSATNPDEFRDLCDVLEGFELTTYDIMATGGNETGIAARLNHGFRDREWKEEQAVTTIRNFMRERGPRNKPGAIRAQADQTNEGYFIDNVKGRVVLDVEWNAKDGNLDRDLNMYRWLYEVGFVDVAVMITREHADLRDLGVDLRRRAGQDEASAKAWLKTTTTTNAGKLLPRVQSGNAGGCPFLGISITTRTWNRAPVPQVPAATGGVIPAGDTPGE